MNRAHCWITLLFFLFVGCKKEQHASFVTVYPNPFTDKITLQISLDKPSPLEITILDGKGHSVETIKSERPMGLTIYQFNFSSYPSQVFLCQVKVGSYLQELQLFKK